MTPLIHSVRWSAHDPRPSRGRLATGMSRVDTRALANTNAFEDCLVMTRNPRVIWFHLPRTKVFQPDSPAQWGILWWRDVDDALLGELHQTCLQICAEIGLTEFCAMCRPRGAIAHAYWQEMLGNHYQHLRGRS